MKVFVRGVVYERVVVGTGKDQALEFGGGRAGRYTKDTPLDEREEDTGFSLMRWYDQVVRIRHPLSAMLFPMKSRCKIKTPHIYP